MSYDIRRAVVIGSGTMGGGLAALLANVGIPVTLLDIAPTELTPKEESRGLALDHPSVRNRIVNTGMQRILKSRPAALTSKNNARLITVGNLEDDFDAVSQADWVLEVIIEQLEPKRALMERIEATRKAGSITTTNTSGLPVHQIIEGRSDDFRAHFLGTHFFNPPRYLRLLEVIPHADTSKEVLDYVIRFGEDVLGKGVVVCKDTPNFIANRFASAAGAYEIAYALDNGYTFEEVDNLAGPLIGRPKTAVFRLMDLVGLDVMAHVNNNLYDAIPNDESRDLLKHEGISNLFSQMLEKGHIGNKAGQGFYKRTTVDGKTAFWVLDPSTMDYRAPTKVRFESVGKTRKIDDLGPRMQALISEDDRAAAYIRATTYFRFAYASNRIPEISDTLVAVDDAVRFGFAFDVGPFEMWDMLGVADTLERMATEGHQAADWVQHMLDNGIETFYQYQNGVKTGYYDLESGGYVALKRGSKELTVLGLKASNGELENNQDTSLLDMGDGVLLLEFHSKANTISELTFDLAHKALERLDSDFDALVIGNDGSLFSGGASLSLEALQQADNPIEELNRAVKYGQDTLMALRFAPKPVVTAPFDRVLGGGGEFTMAGARIVASSELYIGQIEVGVGIIPGWGGCKELLRRVVNPVMRTKNADPLPVMQKVFETIGLAKVSTSAAEARELGFLVPSDRIVVNRAHLLSEAKREALHMVASGYRPPIPEKIYAAGRDVLAALEVAVFMLEDGKYASQHDGLIARKLAYVLTGGDFSKPQWVDEQYILDLEREALVALVMEPKTVERIMHMLTTGKPLRN